MNVVHLVTLLPLATPLRQPPTVALRSLFATGVTWIALCFASVFLPIPPPQVCRPFRADIEALAPCLWAGNLHLSAYCIVNPNAPSTCTRDTARKVWVCAAGASRRLSFCD